MAICHVLSTRTCVLHNLGKTNNKNRPRKRCASLILLYITIIVTIIIVNVLRRGFQRREPMSGKGVRAARCLQHVWLVLIFNDKRRFAPHNIQSRKTENAFFSCVRRIQMPSSIVTQTLRVVRPHSLENSFDRARRTRPNRTRSSREINRYLIGHRNTLLISTKGSVEDVWMKV